MKKFFLFVLGSLFLLAGCGKSSLGGKSVNNMENFWKLNEPSGVHVLSAPEESEYKSLSDEVEKYLSAVFYSLPFEITANNDLLEETLDNPELTDFANLVASSCEIKSKTQGDYPNIRTVTKWAQDKNEANSRCPINLKITDQSSSNSVKNLIGGLIGQSTRQQHSLQFLTKAEFEDKNPSIFSISMSMESSTYAENYNYKENHEGKNIQKLDLTGLVQLKKDGSSPRTFTMTKRIEFRTLPSDDSHKTEGLKAGREIMMIVYYMPFGPVVKKFERTFDIKGKEITKTTLNGKAI